MHRLPVSGARLLLLLVLGTLGGACRQASPRPLPDHLAVVVRLPDGYASLLLSLPPPGGEGRVRSSPGVLAIGPGWLTQLEADPTHSTPRLLQHGPAAPQATPLPPPLSGSPLLLSVDRDQITYAADGTRLQLQAGAAAPVPLSSAAVVPGGRLSWSGPRNGFSLRLLPAEGRLQLILPRLSGSGLDIATGVEALLGAWWLRIEDLPPWELAVIQQHFRVQSPIPQPLGEARVDGVLEEWRSHPAVPVEDPSQVIAGMADWTSARDASFGATALHTAAGDLILAVRVRDDHFVDGADQLIVTAGAQRAVVALSETAGALSGPGWEASSTAQGRLDRVVELRLAGGAASMAAADAVLEVRYHDQDPGEAGSVLTNTPWPTLLGISPHHLGTIQP